MMGDLMRLNVQGKSVVQLRASGLKRLDFGLEKTVQWGRSLRFYIFPFPPISFTLLIISIIRIEVPVTVAVAQAPRDRPTACPYK